MVARNVIGSGRAATPVSEIIFRPESAHPLDAKFGIPGIY
jgi:hypothetical protein